MGDGARYRFVRRLGRGGMGDVELVDDLERGERVARKRALVADASARVRFKREFRAVERLRHPALVRVHELGEDDQGLFFTMEAVDGQDLADYCRPVAAGGPRPISGDERTVPDRLYASDAATGTAPGPAFAATSPSGEHAFDDATVVDRHPGALDVARLALALPWVIEGLAHLHAHGLVHRDLKPSNVIVDATGRARLLDFGILAEASARRAEGIVGTPAYLAPEQIKQLPPAPELDLYALGVMLFELACGRPPFLAPNVTQLLVLHLAGAPPDLAELAPLAPEALIEATRRLLAKDPAERPSLRALARTLVPALGGRPPALPELDASREELVGRDALRASIHERLGAARDGGFAMLVLSGPTGAGKSALLEDGVRAAEREGAVVLRARGRASERVAFSGIDEAIDALAGHLTPRLLDDPAVARARADAAALFPALGAPLAARTRLDAAAALARLLGAVARAHAGVVLALDDLQWADADATWLLGQIALYEPAGVAIVATLRDDVDATAASTWASSVERAHVQHVPPLDDDALVAIARRFAPTLDEPEVRARVAACAGRPLLAEQLGRRLAHADEGAPTDWLGERVGALDGGDRALVALLAAEDGWTGTGELAARVGWAAGAVEDRLGALADDGLVRRAGPAGAGGRASLYHDSVRRAVEGALAAGERAHAHHVIAERLLAQPDADPLRVTQHLVRAGRASDALGLAERAAVDAVARHAHDLAADLYELLATHTAGEAHAAHLEARAAALTRAARYLEAADAYAELARVAPARAPDAAFEEAHARLAANQIDAGRRRLAEALALAGDRAALVSPARDLFAAIGFIRGPARARVAGVRDAAGAALADRDLRLGQILSYFEPLAGIRFLRRARERFARHGAAVEAAWCDLLFAYLAELGSPKRAPVPLAARYLASARAILGDAPRTHPDLCALEPAIAGLERKRLGAWDEAQAALASAADAVERNGGAGSYGHGMVVSHLAALDLYAERLVAFDASMARLRALGRGSHHHALRSQVDFTLAGWHVVRGDATDAVRVLDEAEAALGDAMPLFFLPIAATTRTFACLYTDTDPKRTRATVFAALERAGRASLEQMYVGVVATMAALAEAQALRAGDRDASARRVKRWAARAQAAPPFYTSGATRALAYAEDARGHPEAAVALLARAEREARALGQHLSAAIAAHQRGLRLGGDEGRALCAEAERLRSSAGAHPRLLQEDPLLR
ncbi:MAG: serine/threonine-protein kinase PknK [Sandaracinaceae bacterium]|nr:serine/threonine-protein kinase PknK [Sandaracinaceae bacterium]